MSEKLMVIQQPKYDEEGRPYFLPEHFEERKKHNLVPTGWNDNGQLVLVPQDKLPRQDNSSGT